MPLWVPHPVDVYRGNHEQVIIKRMKRIKYGPGKNAERIESETHHVEKQAINLSQRGCRVKAHVKGVFFYRQWKQQPLR